MPRLDIIAALNFISERIAAGNGLNLEALPPNECIRYFGYTNLMVGEGDLFFLTHDNTQEWGRRIVGKASQFDALRTQVLREPDLDEKIYNFLRGEIHVLKLNGLLQVVVRGGDGLA
jgi:hypothetical protein